MLQKVGRTNSDPGSVTLSPHGSRYSRKPQIRQAREVPVRVVIDRRGRSDHSCSALRWQRASFGLGRHLQICPAHSPLQTMKAAISSRVGLFGILAGSSYDTSNRWNWTETNKDGSANELAEVTVWISRCGFTLKADDLTGAISKSELSRLAGEMRFWLFNLLKRFEWSQRERSANSSPGILRSAPLSATTVQAEGKRPQDPPLRCAPVGMTGLLWELTLALVNGTSGRWHNKIVIPTEAQRSGGTCGLFPSA